MRTNISVLVAQLLKFVKWEVWVGVLSVESIMLKEDVFGTVNTVGLGT